MTADLEEICNWWAQIEGTDFAEKALVKRNFSEAFLARMPDSIKKQGNTIDLKDFDFTSIKEHLVTSKELRNARSGEEKKKEI